MRVAIFGSTGSVGLGLSIACTIIKAHGGKIWAESVPGIGSTFSFTLPCLPSSLTQIGTSPKPEHALPLT